MSIVWASSVFRGHTSYIPDGPPKYIVMVNSLQHVAAVYDSNLSSAATLYQAMYNEGHVGVLVQRWLLYERVCPRVSKSKLQRQIGCD
jgi:hypothetical protein